MQRDLDGKYARIGHLAAAVYALFRGDPETDEIEMRVGALAIAEFLAISRKKAL